MNSETGQSRGEAEHVCWFSAHVGAGEAVGSSLGFGATCRRAPITAASSVQLGDHHRLSELQVSSLPMLMVGVPVVVCPLPNKLPCLGGLG